MAQVKAFSLGGIGHPCCCDGGGGYRCSPCNIPTSDLTVSYAGGLVPSQPLIYLTGGLPGVRWASAFLAGNVGIVLRCAGNLASELKIYSFGGDPPGVLLCTISVTTSHTCSPFTEVFDRTGVPACATLSPFYTTFTVTDP